MENLGIGIQLLVVGMLTVFLILLIVIWGGKLLIAAVNRVAPEEESSAKKKTAATTPAAAIDTVTMQVLQQVVSQITGGKGTVASAKRV